jgi:hypothetical protein
VSAADLAVTSPAWPWPEVWGWVFWAAGSSASTYRRAWSAAFVFVFVFAAGWVGDGVGARAGDVGDGVGEGVRGRACGRGDVGADVTDHPVDGVGDRADHVVHGEGRVGYGGGRGGQFVRAGDG